MMLNLVKDRLWKGGAYTKPVPLGQADWDRLCLSQWGGVRLLSFRESFRERLWEPSRSLNSVTGHYKEEGV